MMLRAFIVERKCALDQQSVPEQESSLVRELTFATYANVSVFFALERKRKSTRFPEKMVKVITIFVCFLFRARHCKMSIGTGRARSFTIPGLIHSKITSLSGLNSHALTTADPIANALLFRGCPALPTTNLRHFLETYAVFDGSRRAGGRKSTAVVRSAASREIQNSAKNFPRYLLSAKWEPDPVESEGKSLFPREPPHHAA